MAVFKLLLVAQLFCQVLYSEGQKEQDLVYMGTGVDGFRDNGNDVVMLGGLFVVHLMKDGECTDILGSSIQRIEAMTLAVQKINDDPNFIPGVTLGFEIRETCAQTNKALEQSLCFVTGRNFVVNGTNLGISGVVGAITSEVSVSVARLLRLFTVPQISPASTAVSLSDKDDYSYFLRTIPPDSFQAQTMADIVDHFNWTYVIAMYSEGIYGLEGITDFISELEKRNSTQRCVARSSSDSPIELLSNANDEEYDSQVNEMNEEWVRNSTVVVLFADLNEAKKLLAAIQRKKMTDPEFALRNLTWIGSDGWSDGVPENLRDTAKGLISVIPQFRQSEEFDTYFQSLNPRNNTDNPWFGEYWEETFNCSLESPPPAGLNECDLDSQAISPESGYRQNGKVTFTMDAVYAFAHAIRQLQKDYCQGGPGLCPAIIDTRSGGTAIRGDLLLTYLKNNVSFSGESADINFDKNGDQLGGYVVQNLQETFNGEFNYKVVGQWDVLNRSSPLEVVGDIQWSHDGYMVPASMCSQPCGNNEYPEAVADQEICCWVCRTCPRDREVSKGLECIECALNHTPNEMKTECIPIQPSYLMWSSGWSIFIVLLTIFGIIATTTVAIIFIVHYKHPLVKASSRELTAVILTGIMLCYLLPFFFIEKPSPWSCAVRRFGVGFCFCLYYSALLVRTNRIHRIFNRSSMSTQAPPLISPQSQIFFVVLLVAIQAVIASVWLIVERPAAESTFDGLTGVLKCSESPYIGVSITLGYNVLLLVITTYFAFHTRNVPQNFNETKFISFTMYTLCILWLAFLPTYFTTTALLGSNFQTGSLVLVVILNASVTLCMLFVPKIYYLFSAKGNDTPSKSRSIPLGTLSTLPAQSALPVLTSSLDEKPKLTQSAGEADNGSIQTSENLVRNYVDSSTQTE